MARIVLAAPVHLIRGRLGGHVYKGYPDGSMVVASAALPKPDYRPSAAQAAQLERFRRASARYEALLADPGVRAAYEQVLAARGPMARLRALVMGDIMKAPSITDLDLSSYLGFPGNTLRVSAEDNVGVVRLVLSIRDQTAGIQLESAEKRPDPGALFVSARWVYQARVRVAAGHAVEVCVEAYDLAGNKSEASRVVNL